MARDVNPLEYELQAERAAALGRASAKLEEALAALRAFDAGVRPRGVRRADLVEEAGERVWFYVVQRDALGWHDHRFALEVYAIPGEVMARMGPRRARP